MPEVLSQLMGAFTQSTVTTTATHRTAGWLSLSLSKTKAEENSPISCVGPQTPNNDSSCSAECKPVCAPRVVIHHQVPHVQQRFSWDCGLACVTMVLRAVGVHDSHHEQLRTLCSTTSIWTVDLAHLLRAFGLEVAFYTLMLGPNPAYAGENFYIENLQVDEQRVSKLFVDASAAGIQVQQRSLSCLELQELLLSSRCLLIVLVDKSKMDYWSSGSSSLLSCDLSLPALCGMVDTGYMGHYVVVIGFDAIKQEYVIRDPSAGAEELHVCAASFHQARRAFGTDEDLLVISVEGRLQEEQRQQQQQQASSSAIGDSSSDTCVESAVGSCGASGSSCEQSSSSGDDHCGRNTSLETSHILGQSAGSCQRQPEETLDHTSPAGSAACSPAHVSITINAPLPAVCQ